MKPPESGSGERWNQVLQIRDTRSAQMSAIVRVIAYGAVAYFLSLASPSHWHFLMVSAAVTTAAVDWLQYAFGYRMSVAAIWHPEHRLHEGRNAIWYPLSVWCFYGKHIGVFIALICAALAQ